MSKTKKRVLSGVQPTGFLHIGNYLGALKQFVEMQENYDAYYSVVDLHAITVPQDPSTLREHIRHIANIYLACGLDPSKSIIFRQSDVSAHTELAWLLTTITTTGELSRMTQFKDKSTKFHQDSIGAGIYNYPILMAADILLYQVDAVPVGDDQKQHVELTRDLAARFNSKFGETFTVPEPFIPKEVARIMGLDDPSKKMSKSAASEFNYIALGDAPELIQKKIAKAVTDSGTEIISGPDKPAVSNLLTIYSVLANKPLKQIESDYAGKGYGDFKRDLAEVIIEFLRPIQQRLKDLEADPATTEKILEKGAVKARPIAEATLQKAKQAVGL